MSGENQFKPKQATLRFDRFALDLARRLLLADGAPVEIGARAFDLLRTLADNPGRVLTKAELFASAWPGVTVDENNLQVQVSALRKAVGARLIATVPGRGYQFTAAVTDEGAVSAAPSPAPVLFGRAEDVERLAALLARDRLITVIGPAGVGKTALARVVARHATRQVQDQIAFVELAPVADPALLPAALASALGLTLQPGPPAAQIGAHIGGSARLLIFDNCEHQIAAVAALVDDLLRAAPAIRVLATSQARLGLADENVYLLAPLPPPTDVTLYSVEQSPAAGLFAARSAQAAPGFALTESNAALVSEICARLDGIPLALELAAARVGLLGLEGVRARLDDRLKLLTKGQSGAPARHLTLRAALAWSYDLLTPSEQFVFRCLSVFRGGFSVADMQAVAVSELVDSWAALDALDALLDRSLVARKLETGAQAEPRFTLLETMAEFASVQSTQAGEARSAHARHAQLMRARLLEAQDAQWTPHASALIHRVVLDLANLRAALAWAAGPDGDAELLIALAGTGSVVWTQAGAELEALAWCEAALRTVTPSTPPAREAELLTAFAKLGQQTDALREVAALERAVDLFGADGDRQGQYIALGALAKKQVWRRDEAAAARAIAAADAAFDLQWPAAIRTNILQAKTYLLEIQGRPELGEPLMIELLAIMRALGDPEKIDMAMIELAESYMVQGKNLVEAAALREAVLARQGDKSPHTFNLINLCAIYIQMDRLDEAITCARTAIDGLKRSKKIIVFLDHFALLACKRGRLEAGAHLVGLSDRLITDSGFDREMSEARARAQAQALLCATLPQDRLTHLFAAGARLGVSEAVDAAISP